jgi:hypothetical protein
MSEKTYQMLWDCKYCGTQKLLGLTHRHCPTCGAPQDATARYFPSANDRVEVHNHVFAGADVVCPACQEANSKKAAHCFNCGSPLTEAAEIRRRLDREAGAGGADSKDAAIVEARVVAPQTPGEKRSAELARASVAGARFAGPKRYTWKRDLTVLALIFGPLAALFFLNIFWTKTVQVEVARHHWAREITVEQLSDVSESAWCDSLPDGARVTSREYTTRSSRKVADGQSCTTREVDNGDGTFSEKESCKTTYRSEPVKDYRCQYLITKWHTDRTVKAEGDFAHPPTWPALTLAKQGECKGCEREGKRQESYEIILRDKENGEEAPCELEEAKWRRFQPGASYRTERMVVGGIVCGLIEP